MNLNQLKVAVQQVVFAKKCNNKIDKIGGSN